MGLKAQIVLIIFTPKEKVRQIVSKKYGKITYESLGENESLGGLISTRNFLLKVRSNGQTYESGSYGRPIFDSNKIQIDILSESKQIPEEEKINRRKEYIEFAKINGPEIKDYSKILGEFGGNPKVEPTTKQIRLIYSICKECDIPIWICDTLEPILSWGSINKGITRWLKENYQKYIGLPLYKIPAIDFDEIDTTQLPEFERNLIEQGKFDNCNKLAEQNIVFLQEACKEFNLNPILIDQRKLRETGAYRKGIDLILKNLEKLEKKYGSIFRVECPKCGKYIYDVKINDGKVKGICNGKLRRQRTKDRLLEEKVRFEGCGNKLEEDIEYLYTNSILSGKISTALYMSNSDIGIFYPDKEFPSERVATGILPQQIEIAGEVFNSGVPEIVKVAELTKDKDVENIFSLLDIIPSEEIIGKLEITPAYRRIDIKKQSIESLLITKLRKYNPPTDTRLIADVMYSLDAKDIDLKKLNWNIENQGYINELLRCLGNIRGNKIILSKPKLKWDEDYQTFMNSKYLTETEIEDLRKLMKNSNLPIRTIMETVYLATLTNSKCL